MRYQVTTITEGPAGSGKTFCRVEDLVKNVLCDEDGPIWTNLPLRVDAVCHEVERRTGGRVKAGRVRERIRLLTVEQTDLWLTDVSAGGVTPDEFFEGVKCPGGVVVIDEAHRYCGPDHSPEHCARWLKWLGELRHDGVRCELITQSRSKLHDAIVREAGALITIIPIDELRDPFLRVPLKTWYQLEAAFLTGKYVPGCEERLQTKDGTRWKVQRTRFVRLRGEVFDWYDSYAARQGGDGVSVERPKEMWEKLGKLGLVKWVLQQHADELVVRPALWATGLGVAAWFLYPAVTGRGWSSAKKPAPAPQRPAERPPAGRPPSAVKSVAAAATLQNLLPNGKPSKFLGVVGETALFMDGSYGIGETVGGRRIDRVDVDRGMLVYADGATERAGTRAATPEPVGSATGGAPPVANESAGLSVGDGRASVGVAPGTGAADVTSVGSGGAVRQPSGDPSREGAVAGRRPPGPRPATRRPGGASRPIPRDR